MASRVKRVTSGDRSVVTNEVSSPANVRKRRHAVLIFLLTALDPPPQFGA